MNRAAIIFIASIILPSLVLAWLAVHSAQDQEVVLEHQQIIITQNVTDAVARSVQAQMDQQRADFVTATQQILATGPSPQTVANDFNHRIRTAWPMAEVGFAVDLDGQIFSPQPYEGPNAKMFRNENDRFLGNLENVAVYNSKFSVGSQNDVSISANGAFLMNDTLMTELSAKVQPLQKEKREAQFRTAPEQSGVASGSFSGQTAQAPTKLAAQLSSDSASTQVAAQQAQEGGAVGGQITSATTTVNVASAPGAPKSAAALSTDKLVAATDSVSQSKEASLTRTHSANSTSYTGAVALSGSTDSTGLPTSSGALHAVAQRQQQQKSTRDISTADISDQNATPDIVPPAATATVSAPAQITPMAAPVASAMPVVEGKISEQRTGNDTSPPVVLDRLTVNPDALASNVNTRNVIPQKQLASGNQAMLSNSVAEQSDFRRVIGSDTSGELARFLDNKLRLLVWSHPDGQLVYGAQIDSAKLVEALKSSFQIPEMQTVTASSLGRYTGPQYCIAILDDTGHPIAKNISDFTADWKHPFVSTEIGDALPHWEAALYLVRPQQFGDQAHVLQLTIALIVFVLVTAIGLGGWLIAADVQRQIRLAQQKTDFVSNVSHELKTPLTSIRMFADLLAEKRVPDEEKQAAYLRIIAAEASRLTRLINNVLDFARLEKNKPPGEQHDCDLAEAARDVAGTCTPHLEAGQIKFQLEVESEPLPIRGDRDALAQIILNLISNAEKYGGSDVLVRVRRQDTSTGPFGCVDVLDRGAGIPPREAKAIFEPFHRLEESLANGVPGTGLGLTLARRMARTHGGDVTYSARAGGGSCFTLSVPLART